MARILRLNPISKVQLETAYEIQAAQEKLRFIAKMGGPIVCCANKYTIKSINSTDSIQARNPHSAQNIDWPGETHNGQGFQIC
jgi:hypothetical protein